MTTISNLPSLSTLTNQIILPIIDLTDGPGRTKKLTLAQLVTLSSGPSGPAGLSGGTGPSGPVGPSGPPANQNLNTSNTATFRSIIVTNTSTGIQFGDNSVQTTAFINRTQELSGLSSGNVSLSKSQIVGSILTGNPPTSGRTLYLPTAASNMAGTVLIIKNRSMTNTFDVFGGISLIITLGINSGIQIACDGFSWFTV